MSEDKNPVSPARRFRMRPILTVAVLCLATAGLEAHGDWLEKGKDLIGGLTGDDATNSALSTGEISSGLKEALHVGTQAVVSRLGRTGGFNSDPAVHIPLPASLETVKSSLERFGIDAQLADLELKLNRAAEAATPKAKALFWAAIGQMKLRDVNAIYHGSDDAATQYFRSKMSAPLAAQMRPIVADSLSNVGAIQTYDGVMARYQDVPFVPDVKTNLTSYVVGKGMNGIFYYLAREEAAIRKDPAKRTTKLLKKVFGGA
jgi:hypothetical protein